MPDFTIPSEVLSVHTHKHVRSATLSEPAVSGRRTDESDSGAAVMPLLRSTRFNLRPEIFREKWPEEVSGLFGKKLNVPSVPDYSWSR